MKYFILYFVHVLMRIKNFKQTRETTPYIRVGKVSCRGDLF